MTKVLVVDDDDAVRESTCAVLESAGFETESAGNGEEALAKLGPGVEAMVLDLFMPNVDGIEVLERMADDVAVVVVVSAFEYRTRDEVERRCRGRVCAYLAKPVPPPKLVQTVADCLGAAS
jgi:CheY-like chemotaxis protein